MIRRPVTYWIDSLVLRRLDTRVFALLLLLGLFALLLRRLLVSATTPLPFLLALSVLDILRRERGIPWGLI